MCQGSQLFIVGLQYKTCHLLDKLVWQTWGIQEIIHIRMRISEAPNIYLTQHFKFQLTLSNYSVTTVYIICLTVKAWSFHSMLWNRPVVGFSALPSTYVLSIIGKLRGCDRFQAFLKPSPCCLQSLTPKGWICS